VGELDCGARIRALKAWSSGSGDEEKSPVEASPNRR